MRENSKLDRAAALGSAKAYSESTGLGCTLTDAEGTVLREYGHGCAGCRLCTMAGIDRRKAEDAHLYGMSAANRFGGKYIYFCPLGLTCFVSPIISGGTMAARLTVGPFLMVDPEDYIALDLEEKLQLPPETVARIAEALSDVPYVSPGKVHALSDLLFIVAGFLGDVSDVDAMLDRQNADALQGTLSGFITELKNSQIPPEYPLIKERRLINAIIGADKAEAGQLINELLGYIFFSSGGDLYRIKSRAFELIVLTSRAAVDGGADPSEIFALNERYFREITRILTVDDLCFWLTEVINAYMDRVFRYTDVRHYDVIHKAVSYIRNHLAEKITLEDISREVYLTPSYLSRMFKKEMGSNFVWYLNKQRVEKSKQFLLNDTIRLIDIAQLVGFEDQSYFTKVFKRVVGVTPSAWRESKGHVRNQNASSNAEIHSQSYDK